METQDIIGMNSHAALTMMLSTARLVSERYLSDLTDEELLMRPVFGANHAAWQLGHLICSELAMISSADSSVKLILPEDFASVHSKESSGSNQPKDFHPKNVYLSLLRELRGLTLLTLSKLSESDLDLDGPGDMRAYAPTVGSLFVMIATHELMHSGQLAVLRRLLNKPVVI